MPKTIEIFECELCNFKCSKKSNLNIHFSTNKHISFVKLNTLNAENAENITNEFKCKFCNKLYKARNSLWYHEKKCTDIHSIIPENIVVMQDASANEIKVLTNLVLEVVKSNTELQKQSQELQKQNQEIQKQNQDLQKQVLDVCKNIQPSSSTINSHNTTNSHNKTFNLQFFLNEQCKDAMNIKDFVESIKIEMADVERVGKEGYVEGISKLIIEKLKATDIYKRPLHCSDAKRETMYIKEDDVWNKDESLNNEKMIKFVKDVDNKNYDFLVAYAINCPEVYDQNSKLNTPYLHMVIKSTRDADVVNKVIKKIIKEVLINKN